MELEEQLEPLKQSEQSEQSEQALELGHQQDDDFFEDIDENALVELEDMVSSQYFLNQDHIPLPMNQEAGTLPLQNYMQSVPFQVDEQPQHDNLYHTKQVLNKIMQEKSILEAELSEKKGEVTMARYLLYTS